MNKLSRRRQGGAIDTKNWQGLVSISVAHMVDLELDFSQSITYVI